ncbi:MULTISPECIES: AraC family transcriptional regulator [Cellvibrio]|uniref:AraC-like DNA-binding protein n=1 Tax=Cellvibrio fibrivorans TaxID=126350 RepID=A0ABU1UYG1_9GAMM|nr:AraC family transcriptional regulator [Cellvibrio fibrivorans]MDR7090226.1 AraC-like DNA-binding protein [Cellvibrio fibrivorans]
MIQLQRNYNNSNNVNDGEFIQPYTRTYEEYLSLARIPHCDGVPARVLNALHLRVGHTDLSIEQIASDLNLTKRTLQRRLQSQNTNFAQLRDDLRFHYAIKYLIDDNLSVDLVSRALDFSDRTSFTNAFKRWTGLSPSTFRKLFREFS